MSNRAKVLVVGLDGAGFGLIKSWIDSGDLKNLATLTRNGAYGDLISTYPPNTGAAWSSLYTGMNAGKHGIFNLIQRNESRSGFGPISASMRHGRDIWEILGDHGKSVVVLNTPVTYPTRPVNGVLVSGLLTPSEESIYTYPPSLKDEIRDVCPSYRVIPPLLFPIGGRGPSKIDRKACLDSMFQNLQNLQQVALNFMTKYDWDFFMIVFSETDLVQHWFWKDMDEADSRSSSSNRAEYGTAIHDVYKRIDDIIGELIKSAGEDLYIFVLSDHGASRCHKLFEMGYFLHEIGCLNFKTSVRTRIKLLSHRMGLDANAALKILESLGLKTLGLKVRRLLQLARYDIDWKRTSAYPFGYSAININLKGIDPQGIVESGDYEDTRNLIVEGLRRVRDPETSQEVFKAVFKKEDVYWGPESERGPDIVPIVGESYGVNTERLSVKSLFTEPYERTGDHSMKGVLIISGPEIRNLEFESTSVIDVAPTILYAFGLPVPSDMDGRVLTEAFSESYQKSSPLTYTGAEPTEKEQEGEGLTEADEKKIRAALRALGYIE